MAAAEKKRDRGGVCVCVWVGMCMRVRVGGLFSDVVQQHISHDHFRSPLHEHILALKPSLT